MNELLITSESGILKRVIVHTPGAEIEWVTPRNRKRMLFDDTLYIKSETERKDEANALYPDVVDEHERFIDVLVAAGVEVLQVTDLLAETLQQAGVEIRNNFLDRICELDGVSPFYRQNLEKLYNESPSKLAKILISGEVKNIHESFVAHVGESMFDLTPIPNMMFVRDTAALVGHVLLLGSMSHKARSRETLIMEFIFNFHTDFISARVPVVNIGKGLLFESAKSGFDHSFPHILFESSSLRLSGTGIKIAGQDVPDGEYALDVQDGDVTLDASNVHAAVRNTLVLECGNIIVLSKDVILVGHGHRANAMAIDRLAKELLVRQKVVKKIIVVSMLEDKDNHLDTFLSVLEDNLYLVHGSVIEPCGAKVAVSTMEVVDGKIKIVDCPSLKEALEKNGLNPEFAYCAGLDPNVEMPEDAAHKRILQEREWSTQAVNVLTLKPGKVVSFKRNEETIKHLLSKGYIEVAAKEFCSDEKYWKQNDNIVILVDDGELSRAHGGPRSLVLPLQRELDQIGR